MIDYLIETTCIYISLCLKYVYVILHVMCLFIIMSNSVSGTSSGALSEICA